MSPTTTAKTKPRTYIRVSLTERQWRRLLNALDRFDTSEVVELTYEVRHQVNRGVRELARDD